MSEKTRRSDWTATDSLALDVEQVEQWVGYVIEDGDGDTSALVSLVTRLRTAADRLASYLFESSDAAAPQGPGPDAGREDRAEPARGRSPSRDEGQGAPIRRAARRACESGASGASPPPGQSLNAI